MSEWIKGYLKALKEMLTVATGGRPMEYVATLYTQRSTGQLVNLYRDQAGRQWMAKSRWSIIRLAYLDYDQNRQKRFG